MVEGERRAPGRRGGAPFRAGPVDRARAGPGHRATATVLLAALLAACRGGDAPSPDPGGDLLANRRAALERVEAALAGTVGPGEIRAAGGLVLRAEGTKSAGAAGQGLHPDSASPGAFRETLAFGADGRRIGYAYRHDRHDGTRERLREVYGPGDRRVIHVLDQGLAVHLTSPEHPEARRRLARRLPGLLLAEVRDRSAGLRWRGVGDGREVVTATLAGGETLDLRFDPADGRLREVAYPADAPTFGDVAVTWSFGDYGEVEGLGAVPHAYGVDVAGRSFTEMTVRRVVPGVAATEELFAPPEGVEVPEPHAVEPGADASAGAEVHEVAPGVHLAVNLRGGFHPMFVEFEDFVVAVDAPAGYPEWDRLPASDVAPGPSGAWLSERFLELIRKTVPSKPVRHVVLTHHHADHAGGVRAFVAEGATVLASPPAAEVVRRAVSAPHTVAPDRLARRGGELELEVVDGLRTISDGTRTLEVIDVGPNPHTSRMLVVRLPREGIWFVSDLLDPVAVERYPRPEHAALDRWFAAWLRDAGRAPSRVYTIHGSGLVTPEHLAELRGSARGRPAADPGGCGESEAYRRLDFWVGTWEVRSGGRTVGENRIRKIEGGCALTERWRSARDGTGTSLFYVVPGEGVWRQVWVTPNAARPGGVKEKTQVTAYEGPGVRFRGRVRVPGGDEYLDRTTLTPLAEGRVRQVIETSTDDGRSWRVGFDAVYVPVVEEQRTRSSGPGPSRQEP